MSKNARGYVQGVSREQVQLLPQSIDEYVPENSPVRFIDTFVEALDFAEFHFTHQEPAAKGRPPYDPRCLLKLLIYGYLFSITSSRCLERETKRNLEVKWLLGNLQPDFKKICTFHTANSAEFRKMLKAFNRFCRELDLMSREVVAVDGAKFKAVNSEGRYVKLDDLKKIEEVAEKRIKKYQELLDRTDADEAEQEALFKDFSKEEAQSKMAFWTEQQQAAKDQRQQLETAKKAGQAQTDAESVRIIDRKHKNGVIGYNVQMAVEGKSHMIADIQATIDQNDLNSLSKMAIATQQEMGIDPHNKQEQLIVLADVGYHHADELETCEDYNIKAIVPAPKTTSGKTPQGEDIYPLEQFSYDKEKDSYQCPGGQELPRKGEETVKGIQKAAYYNSAACAQCPLKAQCTTGKFRKLRRRNNQEVVERAAVLHQNNKELFRQRKSIVEHVFGTLRNRGQDEFRRKGREKVQGELCLSALAYNITRAINILGVGVLLAAIKAS